MARIATSWRVGFGWMAFAASLFACASLSQAAPLMVDFTDASKWGGAQGQSSFTASYGLIDVTATTSGGNLTFNANDRGGCVNGFNQAAHDLVCDGDGLGIKDDEITGNKNQQITIMFSSAVNLLDIELLDLFNNSNEVEVASIRLNNGIFNTHVSSNLTGGYHRTLETGANITMAVLRSANDSKSDYALARMALTLSTITNQMDSVPAPPAILLMLPGVAWLIRRRRRNAGQSLPVSRWFWTRPDYMKWA